MDANTLFYGDNLQILREYIPAESVDLVYIDPPFNSSRSYNVLFKDESGGDSEAQITAFDDTWHWGAAAEETYREIITDAPMEVSRMIGALRRFIGSNQMMAYLVMMTARLVELHRVLKPTGSLYLHCDPTASHYLKIILDTIFRAERFLNEVVWWALSLIGAKPLGARGKSKRGKKGKDRGIDGVINFIDSAKGKPRRVLVQVKSGKVKSGDIRDLRGALERENAAIGVFVTLEPPSREMVTEAVSAGFYRSELWQKDYPRLQILTIDDILGGKTVEMPPAHGTFRQAEKIARPEGKQPSLGI